jgi:hypothetical protein
MERNAKGQAYLSGGVNPAYWGKGCDALGDVPAKDPGLRRSSIALKH